MNIQIALSVKCIKQLYPKELCLGIGLLLAGHRGLNRTPALEELTIQWEWHSHDKPLARRVWKAALEAPLWCSGKVWTHQAPTLLEANLQPGPSKSQRARDISAVFWKLRRSFPSQDVWLRGRYIPVNRFRLCRKPKLFLKAPTTRTGSVNITCSETHPFPKLDRSEKLYSSLW